MKKKIRCYFTDFWDGFDYKYFLGFLLTEYEIIEDKKSPDYLFYSCFGVKHLNYNGCIKIFWCGENTVPDLNLCDYSVSLSDVQCGDRTFHYYFDLLLKGRNYQMTLDKENLLNRKFCNFIYSNNWCSDPFREKIFRALSKYKRVDSGGSFLNNMGENVKDKLAFQKQYKFTLAIENSSSSGYVTEKIYDPFLAQSLPIYWGCPNISSYYHTNSIVNVMDYNSLDEVVEEIICLDQDDDAYLEKVMSPFWLSGNSFEDFYDCEMEKMMVFFRNIFEQPLDKAHRRTQYGWVKNYSQDLKKHYFYPESVVIKKGMRPVKGFIKKMIRK